jgi:hypothetical protein
MPHITFENTAEKTKVKRYSMWIESPSKDDSQVRHVLSMNMVEIIGLGSSTGSTLPR